MAYVFTLLLLVFIILLIIGFINPQRSLFWYPGDRTKKNSLRIYSIASVITIVLLVITIPALPEEKKETATVKETVVAPSVGDTTLKTDGPFSATAVCDYKLPGSNYTFRIIVGGIKTDPLKDVFNIKPDEYSPAEKKDGYELSFTYSITNPYEKELICPLPTSFYIAAANKKFFSNSVTWSTACECDVNRSTTIKPDDGRGMENLSDPGECGIYSQYCVAIKAGETRMFNVKFDDPIIASQKTLLLWGFSRSEKTNRKIPYDKCWIVDIDRKEFTGEQLHK